MDKIGGAVITILVSIVGIAILAVLVSKNSNTSGVISSASQGIGAIIGAATSPVGGSAGATSFSLPTLG